ncbi:hypothetical protein OLMES_4500 [Oleiphilus messinensis]|uniref:HPt domain-containing protein n=1 Tax=Oleiphilus messinensis TaxID=141451 RepID=A0A1Y0IFC0_9GAMM|nr:Hpt domain-containing protein [Oleiphilus messinensis]ARU58496.1 hypothetical protein OLMES_4500 [Oleiphilus messinensis]
MTQETVLHSPSPEILDIPLARKVIGLDDESLLEIFVDFVSNHAGMGATLEQAYQEQNFAKLRELAHYLKGSSSSICAPQLETSCRALEHQAKSWQALDGTDLSPTPQLVEEVNNALAQVIKLITKLQV